MTVEQKVRRKAKAHTRYFNAAKIRLPGVTTVTGVMDKSGGLVPWANKLGLAGIDSRTYVDGLASIGTLAHLMVENYLKKTEADLSPYSPDQIEGAENALLSFFEWEKRQEFEVIDSEIKMVSEKMQVGGTADCYCSLNGKKTLLDFKTSKGVFPEHFTQVAAYAMILEEIGKPVEDIRILRIGRTEDEGFDDVAITNIESPPEEVSDLPGTVHN